jgi:hypothetical protein
MAPTIDSSPPLPPLTFRQEREGGALHREDSNNGSLIVLKSNGGGQDNRKPAVPRTNLICLKFALGGNRTSDLELTRQTRFQAN